jgi:hypothetical protein
VALASATGDGREVVEMESIGVRSSTLEAIGGTPLVRLCQVVPEGAAEVLVELEGGNPTGSYKDRMALAVVEGAERRGALRPGQRAGSGWLNSPAAVLAARSPLSVRSRAIPSRWFRPTPSRRRSFGLCALSGRS